MTRKRFVKKLMSDGRTRNEANFNALTARMYGYSYDDAYELIEHYETLFPPEIFEKVIRCIHKVIGTINNLTNQFIEVARSALNLRQNSDE